MWLLGKKSLRFSCFNRNRKRCVGTSRRWGFFLNRFKFKLKSNDNREWDRIEIFTFFFVHWIFQIDSATPVFFSQDWKIWNFPFEFLVLHKQDCFFYLHRFLFNMCMCLRVKQHPENYGTKILEMSMIHDVDGGWWWRRWRRRCGGLVAEAQDRFTYLPDVSKVISSHVIRLQIAIVDS